MNFIKKINLILSALSVMYPKTMKVLKVIGALLVLRKVLRVIAAFYRTFIRPRRNLKKRYGRGSWALVTGSSDGIGKAIAFQLAGQNFNIILSARTQSKLQFAKQQLINNYPGIDVKILPLDYSDSAKPGFLQQKMDGLNELDISILVNNVGVDVLDYYHNLSEQQISKLININCFSVSLLCRYFIPKFDKRYRDRNLKSAIVNVASLAGQIPLPLHNVYSASKAFVDFLSRALSYQYEKEIDIISLRPSEVSTPMTHHKKPDLMTILPKDCAKGLLNDMGYERETNGHWSHSLQSALYNSIPESLNNYVFLNFMGPDFIKERQLAKKRKE